jgi:hypothetical protein
MAKNIHKGTELNNVRETWNENERRTGGDPNAEPVADNESLNEIVKEEAADYDQRNKEDQLLSGDRASLTDE